ncbi:DUF6249 domain-containing protein [Asticcacaulis sp. YBE204]|uniref:DUF6249 domain-containing protein n=1 Tax=Asticcacaulis sp. YBE204 TaxID=1282363 RepID=UPI0003C3B493|nr:DUF6249 domain-containing protein [Asticcacaulis sp. YBE204]ESQ80348.1 hypothetical protein AEYBE204_03545 [Asticcacaulis sp. YBE204]
MNNHSMALLIPIFGVLMPVFIVGIVSYFRAKDREETQKTVRMAIEKGQTLPPEFLESLQKAAPLKEKTPERDIRSGLILIAVAGGLCVMDYVNSGFIFGGLTGIAAIPGFIGVALLIMGIIGVNRKR